MTGTKIISAAMRELAATIQSDDGIANAACYEAAERLDEQDGRIKQLESAISETLNENAHLADGDVCTLIRLKRVIHGEPKPLTDEQLHFQRFAD